MILDLSSWDFFCPLSTMHRVNFHSLIYLSEQAATKVLGNLTCISITPEWLARDKKLTHDAETPLLFMPPLSSILFFFLSPFFLLSPSPSQKQSISPLVNAASTLKGFEQFHKSHPTFQKFFFFLKFQEVKIFFFLLMKPWQRDFRRKLFSLPLRAFKFLWCLMLWPPLMWMWRTFRTMNLKKRVILILVTPKQVR